MKMTKEQYRGEEACNSVYCVECDDVIGSNIEPDANPTNSPEYECLECDSRGTSYGIEAAMCCGLVEIEE